MAQVNLEIWSMIFVDKAMELIMLTSFDNYMTCLKTPKQTEMKK